jgi:ABC-type transporter Mla maintaining outer membrane lipid asymmetry permease subunit MlaE
LVSTPWATQSVIAGLVAAVAGMQANAQPNSITLAASASVRFNLRAMR